MSIGIEQMGDAIEQIRAVSTRKLSQVPPFGEALRGETNDYTGHDRP